MSTKKIALGTAAYTLGTFALAIVWHILLFEDLYKAFGYFEGEPSFVIGFVTIFIQGVLLSILFPLFALSGTPMLRGMKFSFLIGHFFGRHTY